MTWAGVRIGAGAAGAGGGPGGGGPGGGGSGAAGGASAGTVEQATRACELSAWRNPALIDTLAAACAEAGDFERAAHHQREALEFPDFEQADGEGARSRLELYASGSAYRDPSFGPAKPAPPPEDE